MDYRGRLIPSSSAVPGRGVTQALKGSSWFGDRGDCEANSDHYRPRAAMPYLVLKARFNGRWMETKELEWYIVIRLVIKPVFVRMICGLVSGMIWLSA